MKKNFSHEYNNHHNQKLKLREGYECQNAEKEIEKSYRALYSTHWNMKAKYSIAQFVFSKRILNKWTY